MSETVGYHLTVSLPVSLTWTDFPDSSSCAVIIYFTGCGHNCKGCQNPELQKFNGTKFKAEELFSLVKSEAIKAHTDKVVLSGGDAFFQPWAEMDAFLRLLWEEEFQVCLYTGCDDINTLKTNFWPYVTYYKCGKYDERNKETTWGKTGDKITFVSKNQRLYNQDGKLISVGNTYYFKKWDTIKAKIRNVFGA